MKSSELKLLKSAIEAQHFIVITNLAKDPANKEFLSGYRAASSKTSHILGQIIYDTVRAEKK